MRTIDSYHMLTFSWEGGQGLPITLDDNIGVYHLLHVGFKIYVEVRHRLQKKMFKLWWKKRTKIDKTTKVLAWKLNNYNEQKQQFWDKVIPTKTKKSNNKKNINNSTKRPKTVLPWQWEGWRGCLPRKEMGRLLQNCPDCTSSQSLLLLSFLTML